MILYNLGLKVVREDPSILAVIGHHSSHITKPRLDVKKELGSSVPLIYQVESQILLRNKNFL